MPQWLKSAMTASHKQCMFTIININKISIPNAMPTCHLWIFGHTCSPKYSQATMGEQSTQQKRGEPLFPYFKELPETLEPSPEQWEVVLPSTDLVNQSGLVTQAVRAAAGHGIPDQERQPSRMITSRPTQKTIPCSRTHLWPLKVYTTTTTPAAHVLRFQYSGRDQTYNLHLKQCNIATMVNMAVACSLLIPGCNASVISPRV